MAARNPRPFAFCYALRSPSGRSVNGLWYEAFGAATTSNADGKCRNSTCKTGGRAKWRKADQLLSAKLSDARTLLAIPLAPGFGTCRSRCEIPVAPSRFSQTILA